MSKFYDLADQVSAVLQATVGLENVRFVVDRQHDIASELRKVIGKQIGNLALVTWIGGKNIDLTSDGPAIASGVTVTFFSKPVIRKDETPLDDLLEIAAKAIHDNRLDGSLPFNFRLVVEAIEPVAAADMLVFQITARATTQL